jgi:hypothetical protein
MWHTTMWAFWTWLRVTLASLLLIGGVWVFGTHAWLVITAVGAGVLQLWLCPTLAREWADQARYCWWWTR